MCPGKAVNLGVAGIVRVRGGEKLYCLIGRRPRSPLAARLNGHLAHAVGVEDRSGKKLHPFGKRGKDGEDVLVDVERDHDEPGADAAKRRTARAELLPIRAELFRALRVDLRHVHGPGMGIPSRSADNFVEVHRCEPLAKIHHHDGSVLINGYEGLPVLSRGVALFPHHWQKRNVDDLEDALADGSKDLRGDAAPRPNGLCRSDAPVRQGVQHHRRNLLM